MIRQSPLLSSAICRRAVLVTVSSLLAAAATACITQLAPKQELREIPGRFSGFLPTRFIMSDNSLFITQLTPWYTPTGDYLAQKICGVPMQYDRLHLSADTFEDPDRSLPSVFSITLDGLDLQASRQKVDAWLHSGSADKILYPQAPNGAFRPPTLDEDPAAMKIGLAEVRYEAERGGWKGQIVCENNTDWYDFEFYPKQNRTLWEPITEDNDQSSDTEYWEKHLRAFQRQQIRRFAETIGGDKELAARILYDVGCGRFGYGDFVIGVSDRSSAIRNKVREFEADVVLEAQSLCTVGSRKVKIDDCAQYESWLARHTYTKPKSSAVTRYLLVESPSFWEADLMIDLLRIPEVVSVATFPNECGGGGHAEADVFVDDVFHDGRPSSDAMTRFLSDVLNKTFAESLRDHRFTFSMYLKSSKWLRYAVEVSGPAHLVTFTPDNFWKRLDIEIMLINMDEGMAMLVSVPKAQRSFWDVDRSQGPPDTDYKPYDEMDGDLSRVAGRIVATANAIVDVDYSRFAARH